MKKIEFKSQICTTREQSERLLKLGLKKETADMVWVNDNYNTSLKESLWRPVVLVDCEAIYVENHRIPAWSLHRLIEILGPHRLPIHFRKKGRVDITVSFINPVHSGRSYYNYYDSIIDCIAWLIDQGYSYINKDYLEEKRKRNHDCKRDYTLHEVWSIDEHS